MQPVMRINISQITRHNLTTLVLYNTLSKVIKWKYDIPQPPTVATGLLEFPFSKAISVPHLFLRDQEIVTLKNVKITCHNRQPSLQIVWIYFFKSDVGATSFYVRLRLCDSEKGRDNIPESTIVATALFEFNFSEAI